MQQPVYKARTFDRLLALAAILTIPFWAPCAKPAAASGADKPAAAGKPPAAGRGSGQPLMGELLRRLEKLQAELSGLRLEGAAGGANSAKALPPGPLRVALNSPFLGTAFTYYGPPNAARFLAARLDVENPTSAPVAIKARDIVLRVDGADLRMKDLTGGMRYQAFHVGGRNVEISRLRPMSDLTVPAGRAGQKWVLFTGLPAGNQIPSLVLRVVAGGKTFEVNVNESATRALGLKVERIGPRGCLALVTISGEVNTVNIGALTRALDSLVSQKVMRAVIRFAPSAPTLDGQVLSWLQQAAYFAGRGENNNPQMPAFPAALRELHLAAVPNRSSANLDGSAGSHPRIHKTDAAAVRAALKTAVEVLPRDELLAEIEKGHPLSRLAALADGGGRLTSDDLPLVLKYADDHDPDLQLAAIAALRHFGERSAIDKLLFFARKNVEPTVSMAIESLAASRYAAAHQALLDVLKNEHPASRKLIVRVLAKYPRPIWSDTIYSFVSDSDPAVAVEALRALVQIGHPRLMDVLEESLAHGSAPVRDAAFQSLASRHDPQSEELALEFALRAMKDGPPTPAMYGLLNNTKDARAIPLLLAQLDRGSGARSQIIRTLAQIGDQHVADALAAHYARFANRDKVATLEALQLLKSSHFRRLASEALRERDTSLVNAAVGGLQNDGSPEAVQLLVAALESSGNPVAWPYVANALGNFGTPEAKAALAKARDSDNPAKHRQALDALKALRTRSPGYPYCLQARQSAQSEHFEQALTQFASAIELDPELADAYAGRGHVYLQQKKLPEARKDFIKAIELDPYNAEAVTELGLCLVQEGRIDDGIKMIEGSRSKMNDDFVFTYNAACVYGRALEHALKQSPSADRQKVANEYRQRAIADLKRSVKAGFPDLDWMKKDPDLNSLHGNADFKRITQEGPADENADPPADKGRGAKQGAGKVNDGGDSIRADLLFENARP